MTTKTPPIEAAVDAALADIGCYIEAIASNLRLGTDDDASTPEQVQNLSLKQLED